MNRKLSPDRWRRLMTYSWLPDKPDLGRVAVVDGQVVGYVGMVYADRQLDGARHRVVNICAWYLDRAFRGLGLGLELMRSATADPQVTYTKSHQFFAHSGASRPDRISCPRPRAAPVDGSELADPVRH